MKAKISRNNPYWIEHNRYLELKYFCLQYPLWEKVKREIMLSMERTKSLIQANKTAMGYYSDNSIEKMMEAIDVYDRKIDMVEQAIKASTDDTDIQYMLTMGVTTGVSYEIMDVNGYAMCSRPEYYKNYRKFFYILNKLRDA